MKTMLMTALCVLSSATFAQEATPDNWMSEAKSQRTRAEVRAEAATMLRNFGDRALLAEGYLPSVTNPRLRAEVVAELYQARESGELAALQAEAFDFGPTARTTAYASRSLVARQR